MILPLVLDPSSQQRHGKKDALNSSVSSISNTVRRNHNTIRTGSNSTAPRRSPSDIHRRCPVEEEEVVVVGIASGVGLAEDIRLAGDSIRRLVGDHRPVVEGRIPAGEGPGSTRWRTLM